MTEIGTSHINSAELRNLRRLADRGRLDINTILQIGVETMQRTAKHYLDEKREVPLTGDGRVDPTGVINFMPGYVFLREDAIRLGVDTKQQDLDIEEAFGKDVDWDLGRISYRKCFRNEFYRL